MAVCAGLPMLSFLALNHRFGTPLHAFSAEQYSSLITLHAVSVGSLIAFVGYQFSIENKS